ncbi:MAG: CBS domain-containing protein [Planctomycetota bacterium]|nr:CBS domain-containing protein [Planctomycetota bacterium]MDA1112758.1 CBS domain-containing protein [Planctomycetota bacterium]
MTDLKNLVGKQKRVVSISPHATVRDAAKSMAEANVGAAAIMDGQKLVGLFTERDVLKRVLLRNLDVDDVRVEDVMTRELICAEIGQTTSDARFLMQRHHIRHLPVLDAKGQLVGVLSIRDLIHDEVREMRDYIAMHEG